MSDQITLKFEVPGSDAPGYLRRMRRALDFQQELTNGTKPETLDKLVEYLAQYITEPTEHKDKIEALWEASQDDFITMLTAITGGGDVNPTEPANTT